MHAKSGLLLGILVIVACARIHARGKGKPAWSRPLKGWQRIFGVVAFIVALVILLNPEFLALGLLGDTAFFDMLVLGLSLQMHHVFVRVFRTGIAVLRKGVRWVGIPSPGFKYALASSMVALGTVVAAIQRTVHRLLS
jgi:hypothetical protein